MSESNRNYVEHVPDDAKRGRCVSCVHWSLKSCRADADEWKEDEGKCNVDYLFDGMTMGWTNADGSCDAWLLDQDNNYAVALHEQGYPVKFDPTQV